MFMKKAIIVAVGLLALSSVAALLTASKNQEKSFFEQNVDALMDSEIIVGDLCMVWPNYACTTLGEVLLDHYPA